MKTNLKQYIEDKIFITGISGSGKTTIANSISKYADPTNPHKYLSLDYDFDYIRNSSILYVQDYFRNLPNRFVMDGIPYQAENLIMNLDIFKQYSKENKLKILCLVPSDFEEWKGRILKKQQALPYSSINFAIFYHKILTQITDLNIDYYDSCVNEYITLKQLYGRINWINPLLKFL